MEQGYAPEAVRNYLCLLGWSPKDNREKIDIDEVIELFDLKKINRRNAAFDLDKCFWLNGQYVSQMPLRRFRELSEPFIQAAHLPVKDEDYLVRVLEIVKEKVKLFKDVPDWISYFFNENYEYDPDAVAKTFKSGTMERLGQLTQRYSALKVWSVELLEAELKGLASDLGCKTGELIHPTRLAVSGRSVGPSLYHMLEVLGRDRVLARLEKTVARFS
jgi:glutamyl-tRNA synthetase